MKKKVLLVVLALVSALCCAWMLCACDDAATTTPEQHHCIFDRKVVEDDYLKTPATCQTLAVYYRSCECGKVGPDTFEYGDLAGHTLSHTGGRDATCTVDGLKEHWTCTVCKRNFTDNEGKKEIYDLVIYAAHKGVYHSYKEANCFESGVKQDYYSCSVCDKNFYDSDCRSEISNDELEEYFIAPKLPHMIFPFSACSPTCMDAGSKLDYWFCIECDTKFYDEAGMNVIAEKDFEENYYIEKAPHAAQYNAPTPVTCLKDGVLIEYWHCYYCGKFFSDENTEHEIGKDIFYKDYVSPKLPHDLTHEYGVPADCENTGIAEHYYCALCKKNYSDFECCYELESLITPPSHDIFKRDAQVATCVTPNYIEHWECWRCNRLFLLVPNGLQQITEDDLPFGEPDPSNHTGWLDNVCSQCDLDAGGTKGLKYTFTGEAFVLTNKGNFTSGAVEIPAIYNGFPVVAIDSNAFYRCDGLTSIVIPDSVTSIGARAFQECGGLTSIDMPDSVSSIGEYAFLNCVSLQTIDIPENVTQIEDWTFSNCSDLKTVSLPRGLTYIGEYAFMKCESLRGVYVDSLASFMAIAYENPISNPLYYAGNLYVNDQLLTHLVIPEGTKNIKQYVFTGGNCIEKITFASTVTDIEAGAFENCSGLTDLTLPEGLLTIGSSAFHNCSKIPAIILPDSLTSSVGGAFNGCSSATSLYIPASSTSIGGFKNCSSLTTITVNENNPVYKSVNNCIVTKDGKTLVLGCATGVIPDSVTEFDIWAFTGNKALTTVTISKNVTCILAETFDGCENLMEIRYEGTCDEWKAMKKGSEHAPDLWHRDTGEYIVYCSDGTVSKDGVVTKN